ncbi:toxic anion resistance protein [Erysipelotrichaceae bacterium Oil+RF-744-GAM-WT-6]|uniref:Toxic anion resistance protein n=1 Tax=Stecheria intestinalis TaxID=2606630 RepID=A0A7X2TFH2_9FIRM|nr:toxic anion resistance protein [Stecheria intestinalis]
MGDLMTTLVQELKSTAPDEEKNKGFFGGLFKKSGDKVSQYKAKYDKAEVNVDKIASILEDHQIQLLKDIALLDQLYDKNAQNTKELSMYILAGKKKLAEIRQNELPELVAKANKSGLPEDAQAANDLAQACDRFEKKLYDLELTRQISVQMAPQIRLLQNNDTLMTEKIQSTLVNTIPLWKNQIVLALGIDHSKEAMEAERAVTNMTNDLLKKNAETLHQATVDVAKESERGIVDIETLQHTNEELIKTLDEVLEIQKEGHQKRQAAEEELQRIEGELNAKLLEINVQKDVTKNGSIEAGKQQ